MVGGKVATMPRPRSGAKLPASPISWPPAGPRDEQALERTRDQLARAVRRVCPPWLAARADDIVQAALMKVARRGETGAGLGASYLHKVAFSATVDEIRRLRRLREVALDDATEETAPSAAADPERALRGLSEERRIAVTLHLQGHPVPEAAHVLGWGVKQTDNLVYRGLADLRRCLAAKGLEP
jgi:RNA polymerase sigma-70 factor (ECF subfamily)